MDAKPNKEAASSAPVELMSFEARAEGAGGYRRASGAGRSRSRRLDCALRARPGAESALREKAESGGRTAGEDRRRQQRASKASSRSIWADVRANFEIALQDEARFIEATLDALLPQVEGAGIQLLEAMRYAALGGGKRLRGFLVLQSGGLFGVDRGALGACRRGGRMRSRLFTGA